MKLSAWAKKKGVCYDTALRWFHKGAIREKTTQLATGTILVEEDVPISEKETVVYARVSSAVKKTDLESQARLCQDFCISKGWPIVKVVKEIASGMNDNRPMLNKILDGNNLRIVILHKDRLTRFGFNYIKRVVESRGGEIVVINNTDNDHEDLLKDFIAVITSFCCRLYGARRGQAKASKMKGEIRDS
jgi:predicted site-specific integrase-resolvase